MVMVVLIYLILCILSDSNIETNPNGYVDCWSHNEYTENGLNCNDFQESQWGFIREHTLLKNAIESIKNQIPSDLVIH